MYSFSHLTLVAQWFRQMGQKQRCGDRQEVGSEPGPPTPSLVSSGRDLCKDTEIHLPVHNDRAINVFHQSSGKNSVLNSGASWIRMMANGCRSHSGPEGRPSCQVGLRRELKT